MANYVSSFANGAAVDAELTKVSNSNLSATHKITRSATLVIAASDSSAASTAQADYVTDDLDDGTVQTLITSATNGKVIFVSGATGFSKTSATGLSLPSNIEIELIGRMTIKDGLDADACFYMNSNQTTGNTGIVLSGGHNAIYDCNRAGQSTGDQCFANFIHTDGKIDAHIKNYTMLELKGTYSHIELQNRKFDVKPYLLANCESISDFSVSAGTCTTDTFGGISGINCIKMTATSPGDTTVWADKVLPDVIDAEAYMVTMWIKIETPANSLFFMAGGDVPTNIISAAGFNDLEIQKIFPANEWIKIQLPLTYYTSVYAGHNVFRIRFDPHVGTTVTAYIDDIWLVPIADFAAVSLIFDDAIEATGQSTVEAAKLISRYNGKSAVGQMGSMYLGGDYLSVEELNLLYNQYGWDIFTHGVAHFDTLTTAQAMLQTIDVVNCIHGNGYTRGTNYFVYPGHDTNAVTTKLISKIFTANRNPTQQKFIDVASNKLCYSIQAPVADTVYTPTAAEIECMRRRIWLNTFTHYIGNGQMTPQWLDSFCAFWYAWGMYLKAPSEIIGIDTPNLPTCEYRINNVGTATITASATTVDVTHGLAAAPTRVLLSPTTATAGKQYYVSAKAATTFTITIDSAAESDISFDWQAVV